MDHNAFEAVQVAMWVSLFIFALTFSLIQYNRIEDITDMFVKTNMHSSREEFIGVYLDESEIERNTRRAEIIYSVLNIPEMVSETGNENFVVEVHDGIKTSRFIYFKEFVGGEIVSQGVKLDNSMPIPYYLKGSIPDGKNSENDLIDDLKKSYVKNASDTYSISYDQNGIYYTKK